MFGIGFFELLILLVVGSVILGAIGFALFLALKK